MAEIVIAGQHGSARTTPTGTARRTGGSPASRGDTPDDPPAGALSCAPCPVSLRLLLLALPGLLGCSDASGAIQGGQYVFDGGPPPSAVPVEDAGSDGGEGGGPMGPVLPANCQAGGSNASSNWSDLYTCYFGPPPGVGYCGSASCHGPNGSGSSFWICGATAADCGMGIQSVIGATDPMNTALYPALHKEDGSGTMPLNSSFECTPCAYTFTDYDLMRIATWIMNGAKTP